MLYDLAFQVLSLVSHHPFFCTFSSQGLPLSPLYQPCSCLFLTLHMLFSVPWTLAFSSLLPTWLQVFTWTVLAQGSLYSSSWLGLSVCLSPSPHPLLSLAHSHIHSCSRTHNCKLLYNIVYVFAFHCTYHSDHFTFMCMNSCRDECSVPWL